MIYYIALVLLLPAVAVFIYWLVQPILLTYTDPHSLSYQHTYIDPTTQQKHIFPSLLDDSDLVELSLVVPAYNESQRIDIMMKDTMKYVTAKQQSDPAFTYEVIIVDDGSTDTTIQHALKWVQQYTVHKIRVLALHTNQGKGGAVQQGVLHSRGRKILFLDADGATDIRDTDKLLIQMQNITAKQSTDNKLGICIGSRSHLERVAISQRKWYRNILMYGFHLLVQLLGGVHSIKDTQCGFKLFTRAAAQQIYINQHLRRWCFDVELLSIAQKLHIAISEVSVRWQEIPGSKIRIVSSSILMARDLLMLRIAYMFGIWRIMTVDEGRQLQEQLQQHKSS